MENASLALAEAANIISLPGRCVRMAGRRPCGGPIG